MSRRCTEVAAVALVIALGWCAVSAAVAPPDDAGVRLSLEVEASPKLNTWTVSEEEKAVLSPAAPFTFRLEARPGPGVMDALAAEARELADPDSARWRQWWTADQVADAVRVDDSVWGTIKAWLTRGGEAEIMEWQIGPWGDSATVTMSVADAEAALGVRLAVFERPPSKGPADGRLFLIRSARAYTVPASVAPLLRRVAGVTDFPPTSTVGGAGLGSSFPGDTITPQVLVSAYGINMTASTGVGSQAVAEFEEAAYYSSDLASFQREYNIITNPISTLIGPNKTKDGYYAECSLDVEYITALGQNVSTWMISHDQFDLTWWAETLVSSKAPWVQSISWGSGEQNYPDSQVLSTNDAFNKLALMGFTIFSASGDVGTGHTGTFDCGQFSPTFPATVEWLTAVGGVYTESGTQTAWSDSGGGLSFLIGRPAWQDAAVASYFSTNKDLPPSRYYNKSGRAIPDVSAIATNFRVTIANYSTGTLSGTSAATPSWAGIASLLNDALYARGEKGIGYLNPTLYKMAGVGVDITAGDNKVFPCDGGFAAVAGFDLVSGWGTPLFHLLYDAIVGGSIVGK